MAQSTFTPTIRSRWDSWWRPFGERLLLIPEAVSIAGLMLFSLKIGQHPLLGIAIGFLTIWMALRIGLLYTTQQFLERGNFGGAERTATVAYCLHPWSADALSLRGVIALSTGEYTQAAALFRHALALYPTSAATQTALSGALLMLGRIASARMAAQAAIVLDPQRALAYLYLAEIEQLEGQNVLEVEDTLRQGLAVALSRDDQCALQCALAGLLMGQGRSAETALVLSGIEGRISACTPLTRQRLRLRYGELLLAQGQPERAREFLAQTDTHAQPHPRGNAALMADGRG